MDQEKIGKLIATCRKEKKMTQLELGEKLGVTDKSVSKWENGKCLPDVSLFKELCEILGITLNDFFAGEIIDEKNFKKVAEDNLYNALNNSTFSQKERIKFYNDKWEKEHFIEIILIVIIIVTFIILGFIRDNGLQYIFMALGFSYGILENNRKMAYIEKHAYKNKDTDTCENKF